MMNHQHRHRLIFTSSPAVAPFWYQTWCVFSNANHFSDPLTPAGSQSYSFCLFFKINLIYLFYCY